MKILLTGNQGLLGRNLQPVLEKNRHQVIGIDIQEADITRIDEIGALVGETAPELVIHAAALTDLKYCERHVNQTYLVNTLGTRNVALACQRINSELLYLSTDYVFGGQKQSPYLEWDEPAPASVYAKSKKAGEDYVKTLVSKYSIVRTAGLFGTPGKNFLQTIFKQVRAGKNLKVVNDEFANRTYAPDLSEAINRLISTHAYGIYHVANQGVCTWYDFALEALALAGLGKKTAVTPISADEYPDRVPRPGYSALNMLAYETVTGHVMRHYREALREYIKSIK